MPAFSPDRLPDRRAIDPARLAAARLFAASRLPYLAAALFAAPVVAAPGIGTVAVDVSWTIHADPEVAAAMEVPELGRLLVHLLTHLLRDHAGRARRAGASTGDDGALRWNRAADAEVNDDLVHGAMVPAVASDQPGDLGGEAGGLAESYYGLVPDGPRRWDCGSGCDGRPRPWDGGEGPVSPRDADWLRLSVAAAVQRCHGLEPGSLPAGWVRWAEALLPSKVDWRRVLSAEVRAALHAVSGMVDYTYRRPSRRAVVSHPVLLPALHRPVPEVAVVCDTSGSMHEGLLGQVLVEVEAILARAGLAERNVPVLSCDAAVHEVRRVHRASQVHLLGGGGTDMGAGIAAAAALRPRPSVIVVLTDGYTPWPDAPPPRSRVVVGLLGDRPGRARRAHPPPGWARVVDIES